MKTKLNIELCVVCDFDGKDAKDVEKEKIDLGAKLLYGNPGANISFVEPGEAKDGIWQKKEGDEKKCDFNDLLKEGKEDAIHLSIKNRQKPNHDAFRQVLDNHYDIDKETAKKIMEERRVGVEVKKKMDTKKSYLFQI